MTILVGIASGFMIGVLLCLVGLRLSMIRQERKSADAAPEILTQQFSSEHLSSDALALVIERGYRARLWDVWSDFLDTKPSYDRTIEILGPPDSELVEQVPAMPGEKELSDRLANVRVTYHIGCFDFKGVPADTFSVLEVIFRDGAFVAWCEAGLNDPPAAQA